MKNGTIYSNNIENVNNIFRNIFISFLIPNTLANALMFAHIRFIEWIIKSIGTIVIVLITMLEDNFKLNQHTCFCWLTCECEWCTYKDKISCFFYNDMHVSKWRQNEIKRLLWSFENQFQSGTVKISNIKLKFIAIFFAIATAFVLVTGGSPTLMPCPSTLIQPLKVRMHQSHANQSSVDQLRSVCPVIRSPPNNVNPKSFSIHLKIQERFLDVK